VHLVDERDDLPVAALDLVEHGAQPLSNSPRYFAPATIAPRSSAMSVLPRSESGTSPATMRCARPSTTAVLPTPGSPMRPGCSWYAGTAPARRADLGVAADHRVEQAVAGARREVDAVLLERLEGASGSADVTLAPARIRSTASFSAVSPAPR
jgi:hypothetical protein